MVTCKDCIHYEPCRDTYYNDEEQTRIPFGFFEQDGINIITKCKYCGEEIMQDSQGNWF